MTANTRTAAVIISYRDGAVLAASLEQIIHQVDGVVVVDNGSTDPATQTILGELERRPGDKLVLLRNEKNLGIAAALNRGAAWALKQGFAWIVTMDQDSHAGPLMVARLRAAAENDPSIGIAAPSCKVFPLPGVPTPPPPVESGPIRDAPFVQTSGNLVGTAFWARMGGLREDFFIDYVDYEFCWRVRQAGFRVVVVPSAVQTQRFGHPTVVRYLGRQRVCSNYSRARLYYQARNGVFLARSIGSAGFARDVARWVRGQSVNVALFEADKAAKLSAIARGLIDGVRGRLGPLDT